MAEEEIGAVDDLKEDGERLWVVTLRLRSAARFEGDKDLHLIADAESTGSACGVKIRNMRYHSEGGGTYVSGLAFEAAGHATGSEEAVKVLANLAYSYVHVAAVAANAAFSEAYELLAYAPPSDELPGRFHTQKSCVAQPPAARLRQMRAEDFLEAMQGLNAHMDEERLHRAMAHYGLALNALEPRSWVLAAEHLFIAVENLQRVVFRRICRERDLPADGKSKHLLAEEAGFEAQGDDNTHLYDYDGHLRRQHIFHGDEGCYKALKAASDHFEHGSRGFAEVREKADASAEKAFGHVRKTILQELGIDPKSALFGSRYSFPLGAWHPKFETWGDFDYTEEVEALDIELESVGKEWPPFHGLNLSGRIANIIDDDGEGKRTISFGVKGNGASLGDNHEVILRGTRWVMPSIDEDEVITDDDFSLKFQTEHE